MFQSILYLNTNDLLKVSVMNYDSTLYHSLKLTVKTGITLLRDFPQSKRALGKVLSHFPKALGKRKANLRRGVVVPPLLIVSTTEQCNLQCAGCYSQAQHRQEKTEMTKTQIEQLLTDAIKVGCSMILLAGGEPLLCMDWLNAVAKRPQLLGLVFTNGTLLDDKAADWFANHRSMIPLISIEGDQEKTDCRRGSGVANKVEEVMGLLKNRNIPFGLSITTGEHNIAEVTQLDFLRPFKALGCRLVIYTEYVPMDENTQLLILKEQSKLNLQAFCDETSKLENMLLVPFPGDETQYDGCLAAGRGFAHISTSGELEPCPFAAYSDSNVLSTSFMDALKSPLFQRIRSESHLLHEGAGGCALRGKQYLCNSQNT